VISDTIDSWNYAEVREIFSQLFRWRGRLFWLLVALLALFVFLLEVVADVGGADPQPGVPLNSTARAQLIATSDSGGL